MSPSHYTVPFEWCTQRTSVAYLQPPRHSRTTSQTPPLAAGNGDLGGGSRESAFCQPISVPWGTSTYTSRRRRWPKTVRLDESALEDVAGEG